MMSILIHYFGPVREKIGRDQEEFSLDGEATVASLREMLEAKYPDLRSLLRSSRFAVNMEYVGESTAVDSSHEVAIIPPVAGG